MAQPTPTLKKGPEPFSWPFYGYTQNHTRFFPAPETVRPPFKKLWVHNAGALLEFPPVIYGDRIFQLADNAELIAVDKNTGHTIWTHRLGQLSASTPAVTSNTVYVTLLNGGRSGAPGAGRGGQRPDRRHPLVARGCRAPASPRPCSTTDASSSAPRTAPCTRSTTAPAGSSGPTTPAAR